MIDVRKLARVGGGVVRDGRSVSIPGPFHSRKDLSLSVTVDSHARDGFLTHSFAGDDPILCRDYVRDLLGLPAWRSNVEARDWRPSPEHIDASRLRDAEIAADETKRIQAAMRIWSETVDPRGTLVENYLASRGLRLPAEVVKGGHLKFHPRCPVKVGGEVLGFPAMIGLMTDPATGDPRAIHRTFLRPDGAGKASLADGSNPKKMLGAARGCVVRLSPDDSVTIGLGLAEGIENAITCLNAGWSPIWAAASASNMAAFPMLAGIEALTIFADSGEAGERAADECAGRWIKAGRDVEAVFPRAADWNDGIREGAA